jgi:hypothetical protein
VNLQTEREEEQQLSTQQLLRDDAKFASGKIAFFQYLTIAVFLFLLAGYWDLQIRNPELYHQKAEKQPHQIVPHPRGTGENSGPRRAGDRRQPFFL